MHQPWFKRCSLPPYCPYLATFNISPKNKGNKNSNNEWSEKERFVYSGRQIRTIDTAFHMMTSSSVWMNDRLGSRKSPSPRGVAHHAIQKEVYRGENTRIILFKQWRESEMDWGLCSERNRCGMKACLRCRDWDLAGAGRNQKWSKRGIDNQIDWKNVWEDDDCYHSKSVRIL